jgi:nucleoside-diphosphate-sugar epimerase
MRIVVTGAAGRVAPTVCRFLEETGHQVIRSDVREPREPHPGFDLTDLSQPGEARQLLEGCDALVHFGNHAHDYARPSAREVYQGNVNMNLITFDAAMDAGVRQIVFASSVQAISGGPSGEGPIVPYLPADGQLPPNPKWYYGLSKLAGEQTLQVLCRENPELSAVAIRFPYIPQDADRLAAHRQRYREDREHWHREATRVEADDEATTRKRWRRINHVYELFTYLFPDDVASLVGAAVDKQLPGFRVLFPAADDTLLGEKPADLIGRYFQDVPLRRPIEQFTGLVDNSPITDLLGWRPSTPAPAATSANAG